MNLVLKLTEQWIKIFKLDTFLALILAGLLYFHSNDLIGRRVFSNTQVTIIFNLFILLILILFYAYFKLPSSHFIKTRILLIQTEILKYFKSELTLRETLNQAKHPRLFIIIWTLISVSYILLEVATISYILDNGCGTDLLFLGNGLIFLYLTLPIALFYIVVSRKNHELLLARTIVIVSILVVALISPPLEIALLCS